MFTNRKSIGLWLALCFVALGFSMAANAQPSDITGVISSVSGYFTAAVVVGVACILWVLGRKVVRKAI